MNSARLLTDVAAVIKGEPALAIFASRRAKFEGWLKVKVIDLLLRQGLNPLPEVDYIDVVCASDWAIQLKTINTNYQYPQVRAAARPITKNVDGIIEDIKKLSAVPTYINRAVLFIVFPCETMNPNWATHLARITPHLKSIEDLQFEFNNGVPAIAYFGIL